MCSIFDGLNPLKAHVTNLATSSAGGMVEWCAAITLVTRLVAYISILALIVVVVFVIMKYISDFNDARTMRATMTAASETSPIWPSKPIPFTYGTCDQDIESGNCSSSSSSSGSISSSEELYDGKVCVICYDEERNCFFVPCGHCATCYMCAQRIFTGENKVCPVCRRFIGKVRKLFAP